MTTDARALAQEALRHAKDTLSIYGLETADDSETILVIDEALAALTAEPTTTSDRERLQPRVAEWMAACFGPEISADRIERNHRFIEEALELVQACGCTQSEAHQLVDYVYDRPQGDINQEVGGVMITLATLCLANGFDMHAAGETELARVWTKIEKIRAKQAAKPRHSPLPEATALRQPVAAEIEEMAQRLDALTINRESWGPFVDFADVINEAATLLRRLLPAGDGWRPTHRHYKGGLYRVIARGRVEADLSPVVIYDNEKGETWVRPVDDFDARIGMNHICRFDPLPAPPETTKP